MNQLLIVKSTKALTDKKVDADASATPYDLSNLAEGAITFFELGASSVLSAAAKKNFAIALGRSGNNRTFVIPEVDIDTLEIKKALPAAGSKFSVTFTMPTTVVGKEYTVILIKRGTLTHERNMFTTTIQAKTTDAATEAQRFVDYVNNKANDLFNVKATFSSETNNLTNETVVSITIAAQDDADYEIKFADMLDVLNTPKTKTTSNNVITGYTMTGGTTVTYFRKTIGDKKFIQELAQKCAAGKGFNLLDQESLDIYPGYPEFVEDLVPNTSGSNGASTAGYALYSLHFATGRKAGKQVDERVWQYVYIAVPITNSSYSTIDGILPEGKFTENMAGAIAAATVTTMVKPASLNA